MEKTKQVSWDDIELGDLTVSPLHQPTSLVGLNHVDIHHDDEVWCYYCFF